MKKILIVGLIGVAGLSAPAAAEIHTVTPNDGFQRTVKFLKPGDTLQLEDGRYSDSVEFSVSGTEAAPIVIRGSKNVVIDGRKLTKYRPVFQTNGQSYLKFEDLSFEGVRAGVQIDEGSHHIDIRGLRAEKCQFAVLMKDASFVTVRESEARNSRNAFRGEGETHDIVFENVKAFNSRDEYEKMDLNYLNGDGFIFEKKTRNLRFSNIVSGDHWDAGIDVKGSDVVIENVEVYGSKNGLKLWGNNILVRNARVHSAKTQLRADGKKIEGNGLNIRSGSTRVEDSTIEHNELCEVKIKEEAVLELRNCVVRHPSPEGRILIKAGQLIQSGVEWDPKP